MRYQFLCENQQQQELFDVEAPIDTGPPSVVYCPVCGVEARRVWNVPPIKYNSQGFHNTDYDSTGDRLEKLNKSWSAKYGEEPPPPAKDVPRNLNDIY